MENAEPVEQWRPVVGYEGLYEVSDQGRVRRIGLAGNNTIVGRIFKGGHVRQSKRVHLSRDGVKMVAWRATLVFQAFGSPSLPGEQWRDAIGWEGSYQVSSEGRVRRVAPGKGVMAGRILRPYVNKSMGRLYITLQSRSQRRNLIVSRLIACAFLGARNNAEVNHINGNPTDNRLKNLEWVTRSENINHAYKTGLMKPQDHRGERHPGCKLTVQEILEIRSLAGTLVLHKIAKRFGVSQSAVHAIIHRKTWSHLPEGATRAA